MTVSLSERPIQRIRISDWSLAARLGIRLAALITCVISTPLAATDRAAPVAGAPPSTLRREVERLTRSLLDLEGAGPKVRHEVEAWIIQNATEIVREGQSGLARRTGDGIESVPSSPGVASNRQGVAEDPALASFLRWLKRVPPSQDPRAWKLSGLAHGEAGSCLGLVCAATIVGRSAGLFVHPLAVPDHLMLQIGAGHRAALLDPLDAVGVIERRNASARYRVPDPPASGFLRPLSDRELLACVLIERGAESYEAGRVRDASRDLRRAIRWFPDHPSGYYNLALVEESRKRWDRAEEHLSRAIVSNPLDSRPWQHRALARAKACRIEDAKRDLEVALRLDPQMAAAPKIRHAIAGACR